MTCDAQLHRREIECAHHRVLVAVGPGMHRPSQCAPHDDVPAGDDFDPGTHIAQDDDMPRVFDAFPRRQRAFHQHRRGAGHR